MTYILQNPEHPGHTRGKGVVPWKFGFRDYIDSYRSRQRRKNDEREHLRRLEEQLLSHDARMADEVKRQVTIAMSQQQQPQAAAPEPNVDMDLSHRKSRCASTDHPAKIVLPAIEMTAQQLYVVDEITQRTPCELQTTFKNLTFMVAYGSAMPTCWYFVMSRIKFASTRIPL